MAKFRENARHTHECCLEGGKAHKPTHNPVDTSHTHQPTHNPVDTSSKESRDQKSLTSRRQLFNYTISAACSERKCRNLTQ